MPISPETITTCRYYPPQETREYIEVFSEGISGNQRAMDYALDQQAFRGHYEIPESFNGEQLDAYPLSKLDPRMCRSLGQEEWEKLNFRLISGSTDWHEGSVLISGGRIYLNDAGDDFVGQEGQRRYCNPWVKDPKAQIPLSVEESSFLHNLDIKEVMLVFERIGPTPKASADKYLTQILRLYLAKMAGKYRLTQAEWFNVMTPKKGINGKMYPGKLESLYDKYIADEASKSTNWQEISRKIQWLAVHDDMETAVCEQLKQRRTGRPAFHV